MRPYPDIEHHRIACQTVEGEDRLRFWRTFTLNFAADSEDITEGQREFLFDHGFTPEKWGLYRLQSRHPGFFFSDVQRERTRNVNGPYDIVFNNKILFTQVFMPYARVPHIAALWRNGRLIEHDPIWSRIKTGALTEPLRLVAKPVGGGGGGSIYFLRADAERVLVESNDHDEKSRHFPVAEIERVFEGAKVPFIVNSFIEQGRYSAGLYPRTVNTLRVLVIRDPETLQPHIIRAVQRIGTSESYPIDNFSYGGLSARVTLETGELGLAITAGGSNPRVFMDRHPDTGEPIAGKLIPGWGDVKRKVLDLFQALPYLNYCGFDLVIQDDGFCIIEGNSFSQVRLFQMHEPLLIDPLYRKFLRHHGILQGGEEEFKRLEAEGHLKTEGPL